MISFQFHCHHAFQTMPVLVAAVLIYVLLCLHTFSLLCSSSPTSFIPLSIFLSPPFSVLSFSLCILPNDILCSLRVIPSNVWCQDNKSSQSPWQWPAYITHSVWKALGYKTAANKESSVKQNSGIILVILVLGVKINGWHMLWTSREQNFTPS